MSKGLLFTAFDFSTAHEDEFHDWYDREHIPERLGVPGFLNAQRWIRRGGSGSACGDVRPGERAVSGHRRPILRSAATTRRSGRSG